VPAKLKNTKLTQSIQRRIFISSLSAAPNPATKPAEPAKSAKLAFFVQIPLKNAVRQ
jgi:hypothetical protein